MNQLASEIYGLFEVDNKNLFDVRILFSDGELYGILRNLKLSFGFFEFFKKGENNDVIIVNLKNLQNEGVTRQAVRYCMAFTESSNTLPEVRQIQDEPPDELWQVFATLDYLIASKHLQEVIMRKIDLYVDGSGNTALMMVIHHGHIAIALRMLSHVTIANLVHANDEGDTALLLATDKGYFVIAIKIITYLSAEPLKANLMHANIFGDTALILTLNHGQSLLVVAKMLIDLVAPEHVMHANNNNDTALLFAIENNNIEIVNTLIRMVSPEHLTNHEIVFKIMDHLVPSRDTERRRSDGR
jgi:ankyrin repeat protein